MNAEFLTNLLLALLSGIGGAGLLILTRLDKKVGNVELNTAMLNERTAQHEKRLDEHSDEIKQFKKLSA